MSLRTTFGAARILGGNLARGQTNSARMLWKFNKVYNAGRQDEDHRRAVRYELPLLTVLLCAEPLRACCRPVSCEAGQQTAPSVRD
jgi:hypothetical protein